MNGKTATLLRRIAVLTEQPNRIVKRMWNETPRNKRNFVRRTLEAEIRLQKKDEDFDVVKTSDGKTLIVSK